MKGKSVREEVEWERKGERDEVGFIKSKEKNSFFCKNFELKGNWELKG